MHEVESYRGDTDRALTDLRAHVATGGVAVLVVAGPGTAQRAMEQLREADVPAVLVDAAAGRAGAGPGHRHLRADLDRRLRPPAAALVRAHRGRPDRQPGGATGGRARSAASRRRNAVDPVTLKPGDYVVHAQHGIGKFVDMVQRTVRRRHPRVPGASSTRRASAASPATGCSCPPTRSTSSARYVGGEVPTLNKLGGADWAKTKGRARKAVRQIAAQARAALRRPRSPRPGTRSRRTRPWQRELEDAFPYTETPDQMAAIDEVKADMERPVPMDRVISGDVGYGKTEIAVRAAFKAVQDGKQVVVLVPTTLLAQPAPVDLLRADARVPGHRPGAVPVHRRRRGRSRRSRAWPTAASTS